MDPISLKWNNHNSNLINSLDHFKAVDSFVDVTLVCEGHTLKAHKIILSAGSNVLRHLLLSNPAQHPIIILAETKYETLRMILDFLYKGRMDVPRNDLHKVLQVATAFEINDLKKLCEESLNNKKVDSEPNSHPILKSPDLSGSSPKKKRQCRQFSDILMNVTVLKEEMNLSPCRLELAEVSPLTETLSATTQTERVEFHPKIADTRSLYKTSEELSTRSDSAGTYIQKIQKDASTECDIQPLKELKCNFAPIKPAKVIVKPRCNEITEDSESDTQNKLEALKKRKRSTVWQYFTAVNPSYAVCRICRRKLSYKTTVTNLTKHLLKRHQRFDPKHPPKLPEVPLLRVQNEQLEIFEEIDFNSIEDEAGIQDDEHLQFEEALDEDIPSTSTPCILKIT